MTTPTSTPMNQRQFDDLMRRVKRMVQTSNCSNAVALEIFSLLQMDVLLDMHENDINKVAEALLEDAKLRGRRIRGIESKRIWAKPTLWERIRGYFEHKPPEPALTSRQPYGGGESAPQIIVEGQRRLVRPKQGLL